MFDSMNRVIYQNMNGIKILHLIQRVVKFYSFDIRITIRVFYQ